MTSQVQRLISTGSSCMRSTACRKRYLARCCGLLAKWLRVRLRVRARVSLSVVNTFVFVSLVVSISSYATVYLWYQIYNFHTSMWVNVVTPQLKGRPLCTRNIGRYPLWSFCILPVGMVMCARAVEHDEVAFLDSLRCCTMARKASTISSMLI